MQTWLLHAAVTPRLVLPCSTNTRRAEAGFSVEPGQRGAAREPAEGQGQRPGEPLRGAGQSSAACHRSQAWTVGLLREWDVGATCMDISATDAVPQLCRYHRGLPRSTFCLEAGSYLISFFRKTSLGGWAHLTMGRAFGDGRCTSRCSTMRAAHCTHLHHQVNEIRAWSRRSKLPKRKI